jgi:hypothetical protein
MNVAPQPFLYPQGLLLYDLSNTGKDLMDTLYSYNHTVGLAPNFLRSSE